MQLRFYKSKFTLYGKHCINSYVNDYSICFTAWKSYILMILETFKLKCFSNYLDTEVRCFMKTSTFNILLISLNVVEVSLKSVIELRNTLKYLHSGVENFITVFQTWNWLIKNVELYNNEDNQKNSKLYEFHNFPRIPVYKRMWN